MTWDKWLPEVDEAGEPIAFDINDFEEDRRLVVTFYKGEADGKPVIQIDGDGDFRINVNDGVVFNRSTDSNDVLREMALALYHEEVGLRGRGRYDRYELVKIRNELIDAGYHPHVIDSNGELPEPDPYMWVITSKQGPDVRNLTALCNEKHMHSDNVDEAWPLAVAAGTVGMEWVTLNEEECKALDVECTKCKQERLVNL
jgi:hypothetical protein